MAKQKQQPELKVKAEFIAWLERVNDPSYLAEVKAQLAKTADGVTILPGMTVYRATQNYVMGRTAIEVSRERFAAIHGTFEGQKEATFEGSRFYSTPEAAGAAADAEVFAKAMG